MTVVLGSPYTAASGATHSFTVPAGVTSGMVGLFAFGLTTGTAAVHTLSAPGATFTQLDTRTATSTLIGVWKGTGLVAGQTVTLSLPRSDGIYLGHYYQDVYDFTTNMGINTRNGVSSAATTTGSLITASGSPVVMVAIERTTADGTTVSSVSSSAAESVSQIFYGTTDVNSDCSVYYGQFSAANTTAHTATITYNQASASAYAALISTTPIVAAGTPAAGRSIRYTSAPGTLSTAQTYYTSATDTLAAPVEVRPVPTGYPTVASMLATTPFYVAHRGGSLNWPEMSLHAYTQSVFWGVGALEVSLNRTSDGVWFGLHDATLDRTSGTTSFDPAAHTWAQVQAYLITAAGITNSAQGAKPYMRWEEIIKACYGTHVIFVDPKYAATYNTELLNMMDALPGTPTSHFVAKYYGVSSGWPTLARARGYKTWGYFYQADVPNLPTYQARWDILGMDYTADAASWTAVMSYGKPVIGHITPSAAASTTARNFGAQGIMASGVQQCVPRTS